MRTVIVKLDPQGIADAIEQINAYRKEVEDRTRLLCQRMVDLGAAIARIKIIQFDAIDKGELVNSVGGYYSPLLNAGFVKVSSDHAVFVEFGTGVIGMDNPHENYEYLAKASWAYASGRTIFTTKDGRVGWIYPTDDGQWRFTEGMESRPFMYHTALELARQFPKIAQGVFR